MTAEEEFDRWIDNHPRYKFEPTWYRAWAREGYLEAYLHQQEKIDRLVEGINTVLSYNLPYLAERALKELLEEPEGGKEKG